MRLRILTYNMHKGFCFYSRQYVLRELREAIRKVDADIVFLQEVMGVHPVDMPAEEWDSQFEFLADEIWPHFAYGKNAVYSAGHHGNAILSKHPLAKYENINISTNRLEQRGLLHASLTIQDQDLHLVCLHLNLLERDRIKQMHSLIERVREKVPEDSPLIIAGDFNDWQKKVSDPLLEKLGMGECGVIFTGHHAKTFPSWKPLFALDRVYIRRFEIQKFQVLAGVPWRRMSDHAAVLAELQINDGLGGRRAD